MQKIAANDQVRLLSIPAWLLKGLPTMEQQSLLKLVGGLYTVEHIDREHGRYWLVSGEIAVETDASGTDIMEHSFCVTEECIERVGK